MKNYTTVIITIILALLTAGCSLIEPPSEEPPLAEIWSPPQEDEAAAVASPTPFPRATVAPTPTPADVGTVLTSTNTEATPAPRDQASPTATPAPQAEVVTTGLNVRSGPGVDHPVIATLAQGDTVPIINVDSDTGWLQVRLPDGKGNGWISSKPAYVSINSGISGARFGFGVSAQPNGSQIEILADSIPAHAEPDPNVAVVGTLELGDVVAVVSYDLAAGWVQVELPGGKRGWITGNPREVRLVSGDKPLAASSLPAAATETDSSISGFGLSAQPNGSGSAPYRLLSQLDSFTGPEIQVLAPEIIVFAQPGERTAMRTLTQGEVVPVYNVDPATNYALVGLPGGGTGWVSLTGDGVRLSSGLDSQALARQLAARPVPAQGLSGTLVIQSVSGGDIYMVDADGSGLRRLTGGIDPALSPDGQTVAFTRWDGAEMGSLWLIGIDGTNERVVVGGTRKAKGVSWSPDGSRIVLNFQHGGRLEEKDVWYNLSKGEPPPPPLNARISKTEDDKIKIFMYKDGEFGPWMHWILPPDPHWGLRVVNVADGSFEDLPSDTYAYGPAWDPVNTWRIVSSGIKGLVQLDVNRMEQWALTDRIEDHTPAFSPDGRYVAVAFNNGGHWEIHRLNADGSGRVALTKAPLSTVAKGKTPWNSTAPAWSPDSSKIAFLTDRTGRWEVWVMNSDGSEQRPLFPAAVQAQLHLQYSGVDERMISWVE